MSWHVFSHCYAASLVIIFSVISAYPTSPGRHVLLSEPSFCKVLSCMLFILLFWLSWCRAVT